MSLKNFSKTKIRAIIFVASGAMILLGVIRGELIDIVAKASRICLQCIGIG